MRKRKKTGIQEEVLSAVTDFYFRSDEFNGTPLSNLTALFGEPVSTIKKLVKDLINRDLVSLETGVGFPNPHIKAFPPEAPSDQLLRLEAAKDLNHICIYPTEKHLLGLVKRENYSDRPFTLALALGAEQFRPYYFDLSILEQYRNDPRYYFDHNDIGGSIGIKNEFFESQSMPERDQVLLETFGFACDKQHNRVVAAFVWYLSRLSPEHQQMWNARSINGGYSLNPDYLRISFGEWPEKIPILKAFVEEMRIINEMAKAMNRPPLFRSVTRHAEFHFLLRPTLREYNNFVLILDKNISDNINQNFFRNDVLMENERTREDGKIVVEKKGTLKNLEEWINSEKEGQALGNPR